MEKLIIRFLSANGYVNEADNIGLNFLSHPDFPSLKAITDTLDYARIPNVVANMPKDALDELPITIFVLLKESEKNKIALAVRKRSKIIVYFDDASKKRFSINAFKQKWTGATVAIQRPVREARREVTITEITIIIVALAFLLLHFIWYNLILVLLFSTSLAGVYLSYLIIKEEIGIRNKTVRRVCATLNNSGNCAEVISDNDSKVFGIFPLSDICVTFFTAFTIIYAVLGFNYSFSFVVLLLSIPIALFSLYQQVKVIKKWCALCLAVIVVLAVQYAIVFSIISPFQFSSLYIVGSILLFSIIYLLWQPLKPLLIHYLKLQKIHYEYLQFKRSQNLFSAALHKEPLLNPRIMSVGDEIYFGANNPVITIDAVISPFCRFCKGHFDTFYKLLRPHHKELKLNFIFNVPEDNHNKATQVVLRIIELYYTRGQDYTLIAIGDWFDYGDIDEWHEEYGMPDIRDETLTEILEAHKNWLAVNNVHDVPVTAIDGCLYPKEYPIEDLIFFVEEMLYEKENKKKERKPLRRGG